MNDINHQHKPTATDKLMSDAAVPDNHDAVQNTNTELALLEDIEFDQNDVVSCKNCGHEVRMNFCPSCGQTKATYRITRKMMWQEFLRVYLNLDKGLIHTVKKTLLHPGFTPLEFVEGKRIQFMKPLTFIAITAAICKAAVHKLDDDHVHGMELHNLPITLVQMMFIATFIAIRFIRDKRYNFWEVFTIHIFTTLIFMLLSTVIVAVLPSNWVAFSFASMAVLYGMFHALAYWEFHDIKDPWGMTKAALAAGITTIIGVIIA